MPTTPSTPQSGKQERSWSERRRWARTGVDLPVTVNLSGGRSEARLRDISRAGVCFFLDRPIPLMTVLELSVSLPVKGGQRRIGSQPIVHCDGSKAVDHYRWPYSSTKWPRPTGDDRGIRGAMTPGGTIAP
jgi:hypothetical protein